MVVNNSKYYPELSVNANEKSKLYRALTEYNGTYTQDKICGSLINRDNFDKLFGVSYFDLRKQDDDLIDASVTINFNYQLSGAPGYCYCYLAIAGFSGPCGALEAALRGQGLALACFAAPQGAALCGALEAALRGDGTGACAEGAVKIFSN